jgi:hypothetical protein
MSRIGALAVVALLTLAPALRAQSAAPTRAIQPGTYQLAITFGGGIMPGSLTISYVRDSLKAGMIVGEHESPVKTGAQQGNTLVLDAASPAVKIRYDLTFRGDSVSGTFVYEGQSGLVAGKRTTTRP